MDLCILFPGIGYHCDKPLLYYSARLARSMGYEVKPLKYTDFPGGKDTKAKAKGNEEKMRAAARHALKQTEQQLEGIDLSAYNRVVFIGKSIGTEVCLAFREAHGISARCVLMTPLAMTFEHGTADCTALHGTSDPWADTGVISQLCQEQNVPLYTFADANHSLETGDVSRDINYLAEAVKAVEDALTGS